MGKSTTVTVRAVPVKQHRWLPKKQPWDRFLEPCAIMLLISLSNKTSFTLPELHDMIQDACQGQDSVPDVMEAFGSRRGDEMMESVEMVLQFMCAENVLEYTPHDTSYTSLLHMRDTPASATAGFVGA